MTPEEQYLKKGGRLQPGERVLQSVRAMYVFPGELYLTSLKLEWIPNHWHRLDVLKSPERFSIPLAHVDSVAAANQFGRQSLEMRAGDATFSFQLHDGPALLPFGLSLWRLRQWADAIDAARRALTQP